MHWWYGGFHMGWMMLFWTIGIALAAVLVWAFLKSSGQTPAGRSRESPEDVLERRYAEGEIDRDTYRQMRAELRG